MAILYWKGIKINLILYHKKYVWFENKKNKKILKFNKLFLYIFYNSFHLFLLTT